MEISIVTTFSEMKTRSETIISLSVDA